MEKRSVYFAKAGGLNVVKIGSTAGSVPERLRRLQTGCPEKLEILLVLPNGTYELETKFHKKFSKYRIQGEWFIYGSDLRAHIQKVHYNREIAAGKQEEEEFEKYQQEMDDKYERQIEEECYREEEMVCLNE